MIPTAAPVSAPDLLILPQGYYSDLAGMPLASVLLLFLTTAAENLKASPDGARYWQPFWQIAHKVSPQHRRCPYGREQYVIQADGTLGPRETNWDSGD